jgi:hypothetical protein
MREEVIKELGRIRPVNRAFVLLAIMDIRAHPISFSERP